MSFTISNDVLDIEPAVLSHETEHGEDDEAGEDARAAVDDGNDQGIPGRGEMRRQAQFVTEGTQQLARVCMMRYPPPMVGRF